MPGCPNKRQRRERWEAWKTDPEAIQELWDSLAEGESLLAWTQRHDFPWSSVKVWIDDDSTRSVKYARACKDRAEKSIFECEQIADDSRNDTQRDEEGNVIENVDSVRRADLRIKTRQWSASKFDRAKFGDHIKQEIKAEVTLADALAAIPAVTVSVSQTP